MGATIKGTRGQKADVNRITKKDTGTADAPIAKSSKMTDTRVKTAAVKEDQQQGTPVSSRVKGQRVRGTPSL